MKVRFKKTIESPKSKITIFGDFKENIIVEVAYAYKFGPIVSYVVGKLMNRGFLWFGSEVDEMGDVVPSGRRCQAGFEFCLITKNEFKKRLLQNNSRDGCINTKNM